MRMSSRSSSYRRGLASTFFRQRILYPLRRIKRLCVATGLALLDSTTFECPICSYRGIFVPLRDAIVPRRYALCPNCGASERHRLHAKVLERVLPRLAQPHTIALHVAPEPQLVAMIKGAFGTYATTDLSAPNVDIAADLRRMPLRDASVDFVFASHVLDFIWEGRAAIAEIHRVLKPNGIAVLSVPILCDTTVEYPHPVSTEGGRARAPGRDYFARYEEWFRTVTVYTSADFPERHQLYVYEDRTVFPNELAPYRPPMAGQRHLDYVPVCVK